MSRTYSYKLITETESINELMVDLCRAVDPEDARELEEQIPLKTTNEVSTEFGKIKYGISGMKLEPHGHTENSYCLSLPLPLKVSQNNSELEHIGCVWTSISVGEQWTMLEMRAATSSISLDFAEYDFKINMINLFPSAKFILYNNESEEDEIIFPNFGRHKIPDNEEFEVEELDWAVNINWLGSYLASICK